MRAALGVAAGIAAALGLALALSVVFSGAVQAGEPNQHNGVAVKGYDVVAYFKDGRATKGDASITTQYASTTYAFSSVANRDAFLASPQQYLPQFDGFCAYGVTGGYKADVSPEVFAVVNGKLYLNYSAKVGEMWVKDRDALIEKANAKWPDVEKTTKIIR